MADWLMQAVVLLVLLVLVTGLVGRSIGNQAAAIFAVTGTLLLAVTGWLSLIHADHPLAQVIGWAIPIVLVLVALKMWRVLLTWTRKDEAARAALAGSAV
jgi:hypothetical protein